MSLAMKTLLTEIVCRSAKPDHPGKQTMLWVTQIPAFGLRLSGAAKSFVLMVGPATKRKRITLGRYPVPLGLAQARQIARQRLSERILGIEKETTPETYETALS